MAWQYNGVSNNQVLYDGDLIKQDLMNIFNTTKGSLDWNPSFGTIIPFMLFETANPGTIAEIENDVKNIIGSEPRVQMNDLVIEEIENGYRVRVSISYYNGIPSEVLTIDFNKNNYQLP